MKLMRLTLITLRGKNSGEKLIKPKAYFLLQTNSSLLPWLDTNSIRLSMSQQNISGL